MKTPTQEAVETLSAALQADPNYWMSWQANIAMAFVDEVRWHQEKTAKKHLSRVEVHEIANRAADNFLKLLIR